MAMSVGEGGQGPTVPRLLEKGRAAAMGDGNDHHIKVWE